MLSREPLLMTLIAGSAASGQEQTGNQNRNNHATVNFRCHNEFQVHFPKPKTKYTRVDLSAANDKAVTVRKATGKRGPRKRIETVCQS
jgi:hypothetical protein